MYDIEILVSSVGNRSDFFLISNGSLRVSHWTVPGIGVSSNVTLTVKVDERTVVFRKIFVPLICL